MNKIYLEKLEYNKILEILANFCHTYIGKELSLNLLPSFKKDEVKNALSETSEAISLIQRSSVPPISEIDDITFYIKSLESSNAISAKALLSICNVLEMSYNLIKYFSDFKDMEEYTVLSNYFSHLYSNSSIIQNIKKSILDENTIADTASSTLSSIRKKKIKLEQDIKSKLTNLLHSSTYSKYIQENIVTIRNNRYVIPVKQEYRSLIKGFIHDMSQSGSTVFIEPISVFELNNELNNLKIEEIAEIEKILFNLSSLLFDYTKEISLDVDLIGQLDFIFAKARYSNSIQGISPIINNEKIVNLINARHPLIDKTNVVPISINIGADFKLLIITGPNTGGKTVCLKTVGLLELMACSGLNIPAAENSSIFVFDNIFADIGDDQSISDSLSTFSSHITNISKILNTASSHSLVLVDELGSGTDPIERSKSCNKYFRIF